MMNLFGSRSLIGKWIVGWIITMLSLGTQSAAAISLQPSFLIEQVVTGSGSDESYQLMVQLIPPGQETQVLDSAMKKNPQGEYTLFVDKRADQGKMNEIQASTQGLHQPQIIPLDAKRLRTEILANLEKYPELKPDYEMILKALRAEKIEGLKSAASGLLVSMVGAGLFGGSYFVISGNLDVATKMFGLAFLVNGFQAVAHPLWSGYLKAGGKIGVAFNKLISKVLGKTLELGAVPENLGKLLAAAGFNMGVAAAVTTLQGAVITLPMIVTMGLMGSWDTIGDLVMDRFKNVGLVHDKFPEKFTRVRVMVAPAVEAAMYATGPLAIGAMAVMSVVGSSGLISLFTALHIKNMVEKKKAQRAEKESQRPLTARERFLRSRELQRAEFEAAELARTPTVLTRNEFQGFLSRFGGGVSPTLERCQGVLEPELN